MRSCPGDNSKKEPGRLLDWVETTGSLYAQGPLPNDAPPAAAGQHVTKAVLEEFLGRGHDWIKDATRCHALMDTDNQDIRDMTSTLLRDGVHLGAGGLVKRLRTIVGDTVFWAKVETMKKRERSQNIGREAASSPSSTSSEQSPRHRPKKSRANREVGLGEFCLVGFSGNRSFTYLCCGDHPRGPNRNESSDGTPARNHIQGPQEPQSSRSRPPAGPVTARVHGWTDDDSSPPRMPVPMESSLVAEG